MSFRPLTARRAASALAIAVATLGGAVITVPLTTAQSAADPSPNCSVQSTPGNNSLSCGPQTVTPQGAPTEMGLTGANDNNAGVFGPAGPAR